MISRCLLVLFLVAALHLPVAPAAPPALAIPPGTASAWGSNAAGELGYGIPPADHSTPGSVSGLSEVVAIAAGAGHSLALKMDGSVWAWGRNDFGQLGDGCTINVTCTNKSTPVKVSSLPPGIVAIAAGGGHNLAMRPNGTVYAWGLNNFGQLADGTTISKSTPAPVKTISGPFSGAALIEAGDGHSLAVKTDGTVWAWGLNNAGQLGDGTTNNSLLPVQVTALSPSGTVKVTGIAAGLGHSLARKSNGTVWAWGFNANGQLGNGTTTNKSTPVQVLGGLTQVVAIAAGRSHSLALNPDGTVRAWGQNAGGQLGNGTTTDSSTPVQVMAGVRGGGPLTGIVAIGAGSRHSLAARSDGAALAWGQNANGQLGNGTTTDSSTPVQVSGLTAITAVAGGGAHSLAAALAGPVWSWGGDGCGQLGNGTFISSRSTPGLVSGLAGVVALAAGGGSLHSLALKADGTLWAWGACANNDGQLGNGANTFEPLPVQVKDANGKGFLQDITAIAAGCGTSLAVSKKGRLWAWGRNSNGQLGDGTLTYSNLPVQVKGPGGAGFLNNVKAIAVGCEHSLALKIDGTVVAWGHDGFGQVGDGPPAAGNKLTPVQVKGLMDVVAIAAGDAHSLAVKADGSVWAWGYNSNGQLGMGASGGIRDEPVQVSAASGPGFLTGVKAVAAGATGSMALKGDGTVWTWGWNASGQLGNGTTTDSSVPVQVSGLTGAVTIAAGSYHRLAAKSDGTLWAWGSNGNGELGNGTTTDSSVPVQVNSLVGVAGIAGGAFHSLAAYPLTK